MAAPLKVAYNLLDAVRGLARPTCTGSTAPSRSTTATVTMLSTKVWGITRQFEAEIVEQRPDERIEWDVAEGLAHTGVVTFHELAPRLTRLEVTLDVQARQPAGEDGPGNALHEARGAR